MKDRRVKNGCMHETSKGFSLLEIVIALAIVALAYGIFVPRFRKKPWTSEQSVIHDLNTLTYRAVINAMITGKEHRIFIDAKNEKILVQIETDVKDSQGNKQFEELKIPYVVTSLPWFSNYEIQKFVVEGKSTTFSEEFKATGSWFYVVPEGLTQQVDMIIRNTDTFQVFNLKINPFTARFYAI